MSTTTVTKFMQQAGGTHNRGLDVDGCRVMVSGDNDAQIERVANQIARLADGLGRDRKETFDALQVADAERALRLKAEERCARANERFPVSPQRLMRTSVVRTDERGRLWVMSQQEQGWASWGFMVDNWDEVFRRWRVRVDAVGSDQWGTYVAISPEPEGR